jgi:hypothetical protein
MKDTVSRRVRTTAVIVVAALGASASLVLAQTPAAPAAAPANQLTLAEIESRVASEGLTVKEIDVRDRLVEVEAYDANGREVDLVIDRRTGEIVSRRFDD